MVWELMRRDPFTELLGDFWGRRWDGLLWAPAVDVEETQDEVVVKAEIPGMTRDGITLRVHGDTLTITGERRRETETKDKTVHLVERAFGKFQRTLQLPVEVEGARAKAEYVQGVLTIRLPKSESARPREIAIDVK